MLTLFWDTLLKEAWELCLLSFKEPHLPKCLGPFPPLERGYTLQIMNDLI